MLDTFGDSMSKSSIAKVDGLFADNATVYWVDKKLYGKSVLLKYLRSQLNASSKHEFSFAPDDGVENGNISASWGTFAILYGSGGGQVSNEMLGRFTVIAKKVGGQWQIVSLHLSL